MNNNNLLAVCIMVGLENLIWNTETRVLSQAAERERWRRAVATTSLSWTSKNRVLICQVCERGFSHFDFNTHIYIICMGRTSSTPVDSNNGRR